MSEYHSPQFLKLEFYSNKLLDISRNDVRAFALSILVEYGRSPLLRVLGNAELIFTPMSLNCLRFKILLHLQIFGNADEFLKIFKVN